MRSLSGMIERYLREQGAALVGFADLRGLNENIRDSLPYGISIAVSLDPRVLSGISHGPTAAYYAEYKIQNSRLADLAEAAAGFLSERGFHAVPLHPTLGEDESILSTKLPHKTVATRAGLGWIGKCALLVTREYGSAVRLITVLTNAPLTPERSIDDSACESCTACVDACPAGALTGENWQAGMRREMLYDAHACRSTARELSFKGFGEYSSICGRCIVVCPWTINYLQNTG